MIYHNSSQSYARPGINIGMRQQLVRRSARELPGGTVLWKCFGKVAAIVCAATLSLNLILGMYIGHIERVTKKVEGHQRVLIDSNVALRMERRLMLADDAIQAAAGEALSLFKPADGQYYVFNKDKGRFDKL